MTTATKLLAVRKTVGLLPSQVAGLQLWLKADALALADGNAVSSWTDSSANTLHAVQATGAKQPTYKTNIVNGKPVVRFDGGDTLFSPAFGAALTVDWATILVCQLTLSGISANQYIISSQDVADHGLLYARSSDKSYAMYNGSPVGGTQTDAWAVIVAIYNGASSSIRVNATTVSGNAGSDNLPRVGVGSNRDVGDYFTGDIAEVLVYDPAPSAGELAQVRLGLGAKYGIST